MQRIVTALFTLAFVSFGFIDSHAQYIEDYHQKARQRSDFYLDFSTGLDNHSGLFGIGFQLPFNDDFSLRTGLGIGSWGGKLSIGIKYEDLTRNGMGFGLGYSHCPGMSDIDLTFEDQSGGSHIVNLDLLQVGSVNFTINKNWAFRDNLVFYLETGYAVPTGRSEFYRVNSGGSLSTEEEWILQILRPGGLVLAIGLLVGL